MPKSKHFDIRKYSQIILFCILIISVLLPTEYTSVFSGTVGKVFILGGVVGIASTCNMLSALLSSLIAIVLMNGVVEGHEVQYKETQGNDDDDDEEVEDNTDENETTDKENDENDNIDE